MKCAACRPLLSKYVDGEATPAEVRLIEEHIGGCARCTAALTEFRLMRSALDQAPARTPDPRIRTNLFKSIEEFEARRPPEDRVRRPAPRPAVRPAPRRTPAAWNWLSNLAGAAAVLLLVGTSFLLVSIGRQQQNDAVVTPGATEVALSTLVVPTQPASALQPSPSGAAGNVPGAERTPGAPPVPPNPPAPQMPHTATGTPVWHIGDESASVPDGHPIQDAQFGYLLTYPANGWSASAPANDAAVLGRRLVAPWPMDTDAASVPFYMMIDVLTGTATIPTYKDTVQYNNWQGTHGLRKESNQEIDEVYLRQDRLIYRLDYTLRLDPSGSAPQRDAGTAWARTIRQSFRPAADVVQHPYGYAPALALRDGDLWAVNPDGSNARRMTTTGGKVRSFSLAPDLRYAALVTAVSPTDTWGSYVELLDLVQPGALRRIWTALEVHEVTWDGTQELLALGIDPTKDKSGVLGLYHLNRNLVGNDHLSTVPNGNARDIQIAPDRTWIGFLSTTEGGASELYGMRPDGSNPAPIMPRVGGTNGTTRDVREFAWLPPSVTDQPPGTEALVVLEHQAGDPAVVPAALILPAPTSGQSPSVTLFGTTPNQQARFLTVSPKGQVAYGLFQGETWLGLQTCTMDAGRAGTGHCGATIPVGTKPTALQWAPDGQHLLVESQADGNYDLERLDPATRATTPLMVGTP